MIAIKQDFPEGKTAVQPREEIKENLDLKGIKNHVLSRYFENIPGSLPSAPGQRLGTGQHPGANPGNEQNGVDFSKGKPRPTNAD